jgi:hypothetical protein
MIRNETEYQEASERLAQERQRLVEHKARLKTAGLAEDEIKRVIDPFESFHLQLKEEVESYEKLKRGEFDELDNLRGLGHLLISIRIAQGLSQRDLAKRLNVHESSTCLHDASGTRTGCCGKGPGQSPTSLAPRGDRNHSACPWPQPPARCADPANDPTHAGLADRSCFRLQHCQQSTQMTRIESRLYQKAAPLAQANLDCWITFRRRRSLLARLLHFHFHKLRRFALANPLLPIVELRITNPAVTTECPLESSSIALATSPTAPCGFASSHQCAAQTTAQQDEVYRALTNSPIKIARTWIFTRCCRVGTRESRRRRCLREYSTGPGLR